MARTERRRQVERLLALFRERDRRLPAGPIFYDPAKGLPPFFGDPTAGRLYLPDNGKGPRYAARHMRARYMLGELLGLAVDHPP
jgi:hypothetical protein